MRAICTTLAFAGGIWIATSVGAVAAPISGTAIRDAAAEIGLTENVHCRPFRHMHRWGYGRGCARGGVVFDEGVRVRSRFGFRSRDDVGVRFRNRDGVSVRSGSTFREGTTIRGSTQRGTTSGSVESRGSVSGGQAGQGTTGGMRSGGGESGTMRTAPAGATQGGGGATGGMRSGGGAAGNPGGGTPTGGRQQ